MSTPRTSVVTPFNAALAVGFYSDTNVIFDLQRAARADFTATGIRRAGIPVGVLDLFLSVRDLLDFDDNARAVQQLTASYCSLLVRQQLGTGRWVLPNGRIAQGPLPLEPPPGILDEIFKLRFRQDRPRETVEVRYSRRVEGP